MIPYGLHTFGVSPSDEALAETAQAMAEADGLPVSVYADRIRACGPSEMDSLVRGLAGGYIPPGSGNDPVRNPESLPTGRNFYAFDPEKVPSREAWTAGEKAARELVAAYRAKHGRQWPEQVGLVLWAVETIRDEGINVATALALMGMRPAWDRRDKVTGVAPVPAAELKRPRIDVLLQMSGLFRDTFPLVARMLEAVRKGYWQAPEKTSRKLAAEYAVNVVEKGVACCDHTCNNPLLNEMVVNLIPLPGVLSPDIVEKFRLAVARMANKPLAQQAAAASPAAADAAADPERSDTVEGDKMTEMNRSDDATELTSSGVQWAASLFVLLIIGLFLWGSRLRRR
jgi:cobalamin biosynthesis Mg chelatase CobN